MSFGYAARRLLRAPAFTVTILAVFALGIAGNIAVLSLLDSIVLHPGGIQSPERLVFPRVKYGKLNIQSMSMSGPDFADVRDGREYFASSSAILDSSFTYRDSLTTSHLEAARVTWQFFDVIGIPPALGRTFREDDDTKRQRVVVLSDAIWRSQFGSDARVLGRGVYLDDERYEVIGVMPADFAFPRRAAFWVPMGRTYAEFRHSRRYDEDLLVVARLRPGVTSSQADAWLRALSQRLLLQGDQKEARIEDWGMFVPRIQQQSFADSAYDSGSGTPVCAADCVFQHCWSSVGADFSAERRICSEDGDRGEASGHSETVSGGEPDPFGGGRIHGSAARLVGGSPVSGAGTSGVYAGLYGEAEFVCGVVHAGGGGFGMWRFCGDSGDASDSFDELKNQLRRGHTSVGPAEISARFDCLTDSLDAYLTCGQRAAAA
jgi:hypothetical protein